MRLNELKVYQKSMELGDKCWHIVVKWSYFEKDTIGKQLVKSADSVAANISEGYGRFHFKENIHFNYIARGSLFETKTWIDKAFARELITETQMYELRSLINEVAKMLNAYIAKIGSSVVNEIEIQYGEGFTKDPFSNDFLNSQNPQTSGQ